MKFESSLKLISKINFFSFANIVFLLLIFIMLSSQFITQTGFNVRLLESKNNENKKLSNFTVTVTEQNKIFISTDEVSLTTLSAKLLALKKVNQNENLTIVTDKSVKIDLIIKIMNAAKKSGLDKFIIQMENK